MQFYGKAEQAATRLLSLFESGNVPAALAPIFIHRSEDIPCRKWSWSNQLLTALAGYDDARGFRQWQDVGRHVKKGEHGFPILCPVQKKIRKTDTDTGESSEFMATVGFTSTVVFGYEQTDGEPLPDREHARRFIEALPLIDVAKAWGLSVQTFNGKPDKYLGYYRPQSAIALGVENLHVWCHELTHAADHKLVGAEFKGGQQPDQEIVADLGACILLQCLGHDVEADPGFCWEYIQHYASRAKLNPIAAIQRVLKRTCEAVALVLAEYDRIKAEQPTAEPVAA